VLRHGGGCATHEQRKQRQPVRKIRNPRNQRVLIL
jgi:hypothetical protein